jgi:hypothetical protein
MKKTARNKDQVSVKYLGCLLALASLAACHLLLAPKVNAQSSRSFVLSPPSMTLSLAPGEKAEKHLKITNKSAEPVEFSVNIQDFVVTDKSGTPELLPAGIRPDNKYAASTWGMVAPDSFVVLPGKSYTTTLYLQVPNEARPGGRYISVAFRPESAGGIEGSGAAVNTVLASLISLTIEGPVEENTRIVAFGPKSLSEFGPIEFKTEIKNLGDIHATPKAVVEVSDLLGRKVHSFALDNLNIFPGASRLYENTWEQKWLFGRFKAELDGYYGQEENLPLAAVAYFWVIPYKLILIVLLALAIATTGFFYLKKKRAEGEEVVEAMEEPTPPTKPAKAKK